jgi:hypothetical protein
VRKTEIKIKFYQEVQNYLRELIPQVNPMNKFRPLIFILEPCFEKLDPLLKKFFRKKSKLLPVLKKRPFFPL